LGVPDISRANEALIVTLFPGIANVAGLDDASERIAPPETTCQELKPYPTSGTALIETSVPSLAASGTAAAIPLPLLCIVMANWGADIGMEIKPLFPATICILNLLPVALTEPLKYALAAKW
jgi:hypothetical protein